MEFTKIKIGNFLELKRGYDLPRAKRKSGNYPIISSSGVSDFHAEMKVCAPGVVTGRCGTIGQIFFIEKDFWPLNTALYVRDFKNNDPRFTYYLLQTLNWEQFNDKSSVPGINRNDVHQEIILAPHKATQKKIADFLSSLDDKIAQNRQMNEVLEEMARTLFRDWFVDFGPTRRQMDGATDPCAIMGDAVPPEKAATLAPLFPDKLGENGLPEGWDKKPLDQCADFLNGLALQKYPAERSKPDLPVIKIAELRSGITAKSNRASRDIPDKYIIGDGDFIFSWSGSLLAKFWTSGSGALNQHLFKVTSQTHPMWFISGWIHRHLGEFQRIAASKAVTMGHIKRAHLSEAMCVCPTDENAILFSDVMEPMTTKQIANDLENRTLAELRDLLLPKLMSGETSIADAEAVV